tara:strand:- start:326 stop:1171 length:846 start_codon:yes stop_codon:yes gene_type:complete
MQTLTNIQALREKLTQLRSTGQRIALVPTMGNLHAGHIYLVEQARRYAEVVVCTIFVNPMQFGQNEDLDSYPRTLERDQEKLEAAQCDLLFTPTVAQMYPLGHAQHTVVSVPGLSSAYCGASRPGHFDGVATIVSKLFNMVQPHTALFGLKDYQQFRVIQKMVADLCQPIDIVGVPTQREPSGLALSSRNGYLSAEQKTKAVALFETLQWASEALLQGTSIDDVESKAKQRLEAANFKPDYFSVCDAESLEAPSPQTKTLVILAAAWMGKTRLIDNLRFDR